MPHKTIQLGPRDEKRVGTPLRKAVQRQRDGVLVEHEMTPEALAEKKAQVCEKSRKLYEGV